MTLGLGLFICTQRRLRHWHCKEVVRDGDGPSDDMPGTEQTPRNGDLHPGRQTQLGERGEGSVLRGSSLRLTCLDLSPLSPLMGSERRGPGHSGGQPQGEHSLAVPEESTLLSFSPRLFPPVRRPVSTPSGSPAAVPRRILSPLLSRSDLIISHHPSQTTGFSS